MLGVGNNSVTQYLTTFSTNSSIIPVVGTTNMNESVKLYYNSSILQIRSLVLDLCLDDGGYEELGGQSLSAVITLQPCDSQNPNQQFILNSQSQILNPNWPNNNICLSGNGSQYVGYNRLTLWECQKGDSSMAFSVYPLNCSSKYFLFEHSL